MLTFLLNFWVIVGITLTVLIILLENEKEGWAASLTSIGIAVLIYYYHVEILNYLQENLGQVILFAVGYVVAGIIWSFLKWTSYIKQIIRKFVGLKEKFISKNGEITNKNLFDFTKKIKDNFEGYITTEDTVEKQMKEIKSVIIPKPNSKKSVIVSWIGYWPLSLIGTLLNDPFRRFFGFVYESVSKFYVHITNKQTENIF